MPVPKTNGVGWAAKEVVERVRSIVRLEIELALLEVKRKLVRLAVGAGLGAGAALFVLFGLGFLIAGIAAAIAIALPWWAALLIVGGGLLATAALLGGLAIGAFRAGSPPVPSDAIEEARLTAETLRDGR